MRAKEQEEGKDRKRKIRGSYKKKVPSNSATAVEAIEKMLQEKKISSKINYDILRSLDQGSAPTPSDDKELATVSDNITPPAATTTEPIVLTSPVPRKRSKKNTAPALVLPSSPAPATPATPAPETPAPSTPAPPTPILTDAGEDYDEDIEVEPVDGEMSLAAMLRDGREEDDYDYDEY
ncbi:Transcription factor IIIB 90 kDa subunit [Eumeta japonica]|uniref:Transcription factor IIIB 90 kDa subunit n=1 Tax=Eumeta variegata TaxID=151549 RepID=A0A4C1VB14_EUMVA|nr:Transcription factor IIIB 90 kDa subunit [Eumeta japonica]